MTDFLKTMQDDILDNGMNSADVKNNNRIAVLYTIIASLSFISIVSVNMFLFKNKNLNAYENTINQLRDSVANLSAERDFLINTNANIVAKKKP